MNSLQFAFLNVPFDFVRPIVEFYACEKGDHDNFGWRSSCEDNSTTGSAQVLNEPVSSEVEIDEIVWDARNISCI